MANSVETFLGRITEETHTALLHSVISRRIPGIIPKEMYIEMSLEKKNLEDFFHTRDIHAATFERIS